jgi:hypothetical protein
VIGEAQPSGFNPTGQKNGRVNVNGTLMREMYVTSALEATNELYPRHSSLLFDSPHAIGPGMYCTYISPKFVGEKALGRTNLAARFQFSRAHLWPTYA